MTYRILQNGTPVNLISANEDFVVAYCASHGYTYELEERPEPEPVSARVQDSPTETEQLRADLDYVAAMLGVEL